VGAPVRIWHEERGETVKPELTFRRSLRLIAKRWWLLLLGGVIVAAAAVALLSLKKQTWTATTTLTVNDVAVQANPYKQGLIVVTTNPKFASDWLTDSFYDAGAAQTASDALRGHPAPSAILSHITVTPLTISTLQMSYTANSEASAVDVLRRYATALINGRVKAEQVALGQAHVSLENQITNAEPGTATKPLKHEAASILTTQTNLPSTFSTGFESDPSGSPTKSGSSGPPLIIGVIGGLLAGAAVFALLALVLGRLDKRVRRPDDIEVVGVPVVDVDSEVDPASIQLLRSELELAGIATRLSVISIVRSTRREGSSGLSLALARAFAGVGTPTVLVSADMHARGVRAETGLSAMLDGSVNTAPLIPLAQNLRWLPEGDSNALPETLFSAARVERIVRQLRDEAAVVIIDTPAVLEDAETLPLIACSDVVLLTVRPGLTKWNPLGAAIALIQRIAKRPLHICYDRAPERSSVPASERAGVAERVPAAIEVATGS
jgi:capsular polysaccharide biosynthesis protein